MYTWLTLSCPLYCRLCALTPPAITAFQSTCTQACTSTSFRSIPKWPLNQPLSDLGPPVYLPSLSEDMLSASPSTRLIFSQTSLKQSSSSSSGKELLGVFLVYYFILFILLILFFRAAPMAYGGFQARGWIRAVAASYAREPQQCRIQALFVTYTIALGNAVSLPTEQGEGSNPQPHRSQSDSFPLSHDGNSCLTFDSCSLTEHTKN